MSANTCFSMRDGSLSWRCRPRGSGSVKSVKKKKTFTQVVQNTFDISQWLPGGRCSGEAPVLYRRGSRHKRDARCFARATSTAQSPMRKGQVHTHTHTAMWWIAHRWLTNAAWHRGEEKPRGLFRQAQGRTALQDSVLQLGRSDAAECCGFRCRVVFFCVVLLLYFLPGTHMQSGFTLKPV